MEVIIERFEMTRICLALRKKGWRFVSGMGADGKILLRFSQTLGKPYGNIVDILEYMYGYV